eukprot:Tbor_TRINITY_DN4050_c0_g1::TRINITY_DN4050_c0_g1_i1::g.11823::m.11823
MTDYNVGGYSLRRGGLHPMHVVHSGDWMNPFYTCFPYPMMAFAPQQEAPSLDYYKGTPVREASKPQKAGQIHPIASVDMDTSDCVSVSPAAAQPKAKATIPRANAHARTMRRMDHFVSRDWAALPTMSISPIDAELHATHVAAPVPITVPRKSLPWSSKPTPEPWRALPIHGIKAPKALIVGDSSDESDYSIKDDVDDDKWLMELQSTVNRAFAEDTSSSTEPQFHFEWSNIAKEMNLH